MPFLSRLLVILFVALSGPVAGAAPIDPPRPVPGKGDTPSAMLTWMEIAPEVKSVQHHLREASRRTGVDVELLKALIAVESRFQPDAVSPRGAMGLMQITPETADRYATASEARRPAEERLMDSRTNILTGARMLADLTQRLGRIDLALAAWNAGEGAVRRAGGRLPNIQETRAHVHMVLELYWALLQRRFPEAAAQLRANAHAGAHAHADVNAQAHVNAAAHAAPQGAARPR